MKKRLTLLSILICSILCMFGCNNDPYKNMTIEYSGQSEVQLYIEEVTTGGQTTYSYTPYTFDVKVNNAGSDVSKLITISGGENLVDYSISYLGNNVSRVEVTPHSYANTGKFTMVIQTQEGNKTTTIDFQVDLKINNFTINQDNLYVVAKGQSIDLNSVDKYINFSPVNTSQKNIKWEVVRPYGGVIEGYGDQTYMFDDECTDVYAVVENGVLKTFKDVEYPKMIDNVVAGEESDNMWSNCITLKATSMDSIEYEEDEVTFVQTIPDRYVDIIVIEDCNDIVLKMNCQKNESDSDVGNYGDSFALEKNKDGEYDVVLINPNYRSGMIYDTYLIERDLMFDFGAIESDETYNPSDYQVTTTSVSEGEDKPIALSYSTLDNSFKVQAQKSGTYSHVFKIDNKNYPNIIDTEIVVNFHVIDIPTGIKINGTAQKNEYEIFKNYGNSWGARFAVSFTNTSSYNYFVYVKDQELGNNLKMYKADGYEQVFALYKEEGSSNAITSIKENMGYSTFKSNETFYLRHNYSALPEDGAEIYIGVLFNVSASSYSDEVKDSYFEDCLLSFPINISFEMGLQSIDLTRDKYVLDLTNENYTNGELDASGIKLFELPAGQSIDSVINLDNITYDQSLITVYPVEDYAENKVSFYLKCNSEYKVGTTNLTIKTKNGLSKTVKVETFIPTIYAENENLIDEDKMPLSMSFNEDEVLYYFTGKNDNNPKDKFCLYKTGENGLEQWSDFEYDSLQKLFMLKDTSMNIRFYDYLLTESNGQKECTPIDITNRVKVSFKYRQDSDINPYVKYENGKISAYRVTKDINNPVVMIVTYVSGYTMLNDEGIEEYVSYTITQEVEIYIYLALQDVQVLTAKSVDIYVNESLGIYSKELSEHTIVSDFIPNEIDLGADWNNSDRWFNLSLPVDLWYDIDTVLESPIYLSNGNQLILYSLVGDKERPLVYGDLFQTTMSSDYTCPIVCKISDDLDYWIKNESGYGVNGYDWFVQNRIFNNKIEMVVNVYITQFSKLQNINSVKFSAKYADKITSFDLNVADDGIYFEKRDDSQLVANVAYSIDATNAVNKEIMLINGTNGVFEASIANAQGSKGTINIIGKSAGEEYLIAVPKDNIKSYDSATNTYVYYNENLVQKFRIKVADGSQNYPFEIKSIDDYKQLQEDVSANIYYHYILTANLNLKQLANPQIIFAELDDSKLNNYNQFSLSGSYSYYRNDVFYTTYSSLNNLHISKTLNNLTKDVNIGLFVNINQKVTLKNLTINNAKIEVTISALNGHNVNIGVLAGTSNNSKIYNCSVVGSIKITNNSADNTHSDVNIGGMIGKTKGAVDIKGLPASYIDGLSNNPYNSNVAIDYVTLKNAINGVDYALSNHTFNVGGIIGVDTGNTYSNINNLKVLPTIIGTNYNSNVGGVIGKTQNSNIDNVVVYPSISIVDKKAMPSNILNVSTFVGSGGDQNVNGQSVKITNSKVYFVKEGYNTWQNNLAVKVDTASNLNFGGIIANLNKNNASISYTYVRSFHSENLGNEYYANIYISAKNGANIAGLVGATDNNKLNINSSYFNADILVAGTKSEDILSTNAIIGLIVADSTNIASNSSIDNCYAIGRIIIEYLEETETKYGVIRGLSDNISIIGNVILNDSENVLSSEVTIDGDIKSTTIANLQIDNVYIIINENTYYFGENNKIIGLYSDGKYLIGTNGILKKNGEYISSSATLFTILGYPYILDGNNVSASDSNKWIWNESVNKVGDIPFVVLLNSSRNQALYDLIPERIMIERISSTVAGVYDVSYSKVVSGVTITTPQIIFFVNKNNNGNKNNYLEIAVNSQTSTISILFDGQNIHTSFMDINSDIIISEDSSGKIIKVDGFRVYPISAGVATITLTSALDKTIKLDINVKVVDGITSINLQYDNTVDTVGDEYNVKPVAYIDEVINVTLQKVNNIDGINYNCDYGYGYQIEILESDNNGKISINGMEFEYTGDPNQDKHIFNNVNSFVIKGIKIGEVKFRVFPVVYLDGLEYDEEDIHYKVLDNVYEDFSIMCLARARDISISKDEVKIAPKNTDNFNVNIETSNVLIKEIENEGNLTYKASILKPLNIKVGDQTFEISFANGIGTPYEYDAIKNIDGSYTISGFDYEITYELITLRLKELTISKSNFDTLSNKYTYNISINVKVSFNKEYYRQNANNFDLNSIEYKFEFIPSSNESLSDNVIVSISPNVLTEIFTNYYTRGELLVNSENENYPSENESNFVIPGTNGLLKITLDEEFNDSSYVTVTLDNKYKDYVNISQMAGVTNVYNFSADVNDVTDYIDGYSDIRFLQEISNDDEYGIRLSKLTVNYNDQNYFNKTYFVKLYLARNYGTLENIDVVITSYTIDDNGLVSKTLSKTKTYTITQLPLIEVKVDNEYSAVLGKGTIKELQINHRGISSDIEFAGLNDNVSIVDNNGNTTNVLDIDYITSGGKYYITADVEADLDLSNINFKAEELVWGVRETTSSNLKIQVVDFEIESISIERAIDGVVTLKHGENLILNTNIEYKDITIGNENKIAEYKKLLRNNGVGIVDLMEYASAGVTIVDTSDGSYVNYGDLRLAYGQYLNGDKIYSPMVVGGDYENISIKTDTTKSSDGKYRLDYYIVRGTGITLDNNILLELTIPYIYVDGKFTVTNQMLGYNVMKLDFQVIVEDSSSYDKPNPIETQEDLIKACNAGGGDYILLNNLELSEWTPIDATMSSLDGNGYIIKVKSFNLSSLISESAENIGLFTVISEDTLIKNITIDISNMLVTEKDMLNRLEKVLGATSDTYSYDAYIDLAYMANVNFGILAGTNNGAITNAKIVNLSATYGADSSTKMYYHIVTSQGYIDGSLMVSNIGGLVGVNSETGAITNSFVGLNESTYANNNSTIEIVKNPSSEAYNNTYDELESVNVYPFTIAGGNNLAGLVATNRGTISNSYTKGLGLYNTYPAVGDGTTGGLVATNDGNITSSHVEGVNIASNYRAIEDKFKIESTGNIGGFVYLNNGTIENAYSNIYLETQSAFTGGFVFKNSESGYIANAYTTTVNRNNSARGQFTGVGENGIEVLNSGSYFNCYYLVLEDECANDLEHATAIRVDENDISDKNAWRGFSFTTSANSEGVWVLGDNSTPKIASSTIDTNSFRKLTDTEEVAEDENIYTVYIYEYIGYNLGSQTNPLIISKASDFATYIIDNAVSIDYNGKKEMIFGVDSGNSSNVLTSMNAIRHVRLVNNLDFENIITSTKHKNTYLYKVIFAGVLDGNGMTLDNLNINTSESNADESEENTVTLDNFGLFAQIGVESNVSTKQTVVKNLNINLRTYNSSGNRAGILAGTIINSSIINLDINGNSTNNSSIVVRGRNMAGALAGLIYADDGGTIFLHDIDVKNIVIQASYGSLGVDIKDESKDSSNGLFNEFLVKNADNEDVKKSFVSLYDKNAKSTDLFDNNKVRMDVSYAGTIAGVILANNYSKSINEENELQSDGSLNYRTQPDDSTIDNVTASGSITIQTADNAGGLFGYVGENTLIKNSKFILSENQLIRASNFAGGIVGENHGVIEQCYIALSESEQDVLDSEIIGRSSDRQNYTQLFDSLTSTTYTVSIGGIAGYSLNGVILDSYSKVNVTKPKAYIAGGVIGYAEGYNYMAFTYATSAVYSKFIIGGLVGLQVSSADYTTSNSTMAGSSAVANMYTMTDSVNMDSVYALTDWNVSVEDVDFRKEITDKLYENQKVLYSKNSDGTYYKFYIKMPEIGNLNIAENNNLYASLHNEYYIGSAVGYLMLKTNGSSARKFIDKVSISDVDLATLDRNINVVTNLKDISSGVVTNTLGLYSTTGSLASGDRIDSYNTSSYNYYINENTYINMYSFRIAYISDLNAYDLVEIDSTNNDKYFDVFTYPKVYGQEYLEQMVGEYYQVLDTNNKSTASVFSYAYDSDNRYDKNNINSSTFINLNNDYIWAISEYLPKFSYGLYTSGKRLETKEDLQNALTQVSSGKNYVVAPNNADYSITLDDITDTNKIIAFSQAIRDNYIGEIKNNQNPKIIIKITNASGKDDSNVNSIFNTLAGASFANIDFEIIYENVNFSNEKLYTSYGLFANAIQNSTINNCNIKLIIENDLTIENSASVGAIFNVNNAGLIFGNIINSSISNTNIEIIAQNIIINDAKIENFGLLAGYAENTSLNENSYNIITKNITINECSDNLNIAGLIGAINHSSFNGEGTSIVIKNNDDSLLITNNKEISQLNTSLLVAYANNSTIKNVIVQSDLEVNNAQEMIGQLNVSAIVAMTNSTNIKNINVTGNLVIDSEKADSANIGSVIGYDLKSSKLNDIMSGLDMSVNIKTMNLAVGGIIGLAEYSANLINTAQYTGNLNISNSLVGNRTTDKDGNVITNSSKNYVGGIVGKTKGFVEISNVLSAGKIVTSTTNSNLVSMYIGGIVGYSNSIELNNFSVLMVSDWAIGYTPSNVETYVSGVIGYNNGVFTGINGFVLFELPDNENIYKYAITNNSISKNTQNVFYCNEFGKTYSIDSNFSTFALADLYNSISEYSALGRLIGSNSFFDSDNIVKNGNLQVVVPSGLQIPSTLDSDFYNPNVLSGTINNSNINDYNVVLDYLNVTNVAINTGAILSGRTLENGNAIITLTNSVGSTDTKYAFNTNNGVISNFYFKASAGGLDENSIGQNIALVRTNNGVISLVYAYGMTESTYLLAYENSITGEIVKSASATVYVGNASKIYGLIYENSGYVSDCYSANFGHTANANSKTSVYGLTYKNLGLIENSFYYIDEVMEYENTSCGIAEISYSGEGNDRIVGKTNKCEYSSNPTFTSNRNTIWTIENGHAQIIGFKDIEGAIVLKIVMNDSTNYTLEEIRTSLKNKNNTDNHFDYEINFYSTEKLSYTIVRFDNGNNLINYFNSLTYSYIPENTIILIDGDISIDSSVHAISIPKSSMILGRYNESEDRDSAIIYSGSTYLQHELVKENKGVIACLEFRGIKFNNTQETKYFAPIMYNYGVIYSIKLINHSRVMGGNSRIVSGIVAFNSSLGVINNCKITDFTIFSLEFYNMICNEAYGKVYNCSIVNYVASGSVYVGGKNGLGDNDN